MGAALAGLVFSVGRDRRRHNPLLPGKGPGAGQPTIDAAKSLGLQCDSGEKDNVPSGLYQWHCRGTEAHPALTMLVSGNDEGVAEIDVITPTGDTDRLRIAIGAVARTVPPMSSLDGLATELDRQLVDWDGAQTIVGSRGLRVSLLCDEPSQFGEGQCMAFVVGPDPIKPMLP